MNTLRQESATVIEDAVAQTDFRYALVHQDEDGVWIAEVPSLPGCNSFGETRDEALHNLQDAIRLYLDGMNADEQNLYGKYSNPQLLTVAL